MTTQLTCKERVSKHLHGRLSDLRPSFKAWQNGDEYLPQDVTPFNEYGLCFDYVAPGTFTDQKRGYFRYQLSWGGPSDEFRFFCDEQLKTTRIEYWFLDWNDGAKIILHGKDLDLLNEIFEDFKDSGTVDSLLIEAQEDNG